MDSGAASVTVDDVRSFERTPYPLTLMVVPNAAMSFTFVYDARLHGDGAIRRMAGHLRKVLLAMVENPQAPLAGFSILTDAERHQSLLEWNDTERRHRRDALLHQLFEEQAARTPDGIAAVAGDEYVTYGELNRQADALARRLTAAGVGPDAIVGVFLERGTALSTALLAILKAGGAYLPLEPTHPQHYLRQMLEDSRPLLVLSSAQLAQGIPAGIARVLLVERETERIAASAPAPAKLEESNLAYVIYTSGSTGKPKGVMISHQGICNRLHWMQQAYHLDGRDRVLQKTPFHFDVSVWELFWPLMTGACMVFAKPGGHLDDDYLARLIAGEQITLLHFVPSLLERFLACDSLPRSPVREVIASGEALPGALVRRFFEHGLAPRLHNLYGPTEASVDVTAWTCERGSARVRVPLGRPIDNIRIGVVDHLLHAVPAGIRGHLTIAGVGLARGYLNQPQLTAERFVPDLLAAEPGSRQYLTGDQAQFLPDGLVDYLGRLDQQIKLFGVRIELAEIEAALASHPSVRRAVAVLQDGAGERRIVGYVACHRNAATPSEDDLRRWAFDRLPRSAVPAAFVIVNDFPLLSNGKINRAALPVPRAGPIAGDVPEPRQDQISELLAAIWSRLLGIERVGPDDDFFALGGHSILAMQMVSRVRDVFNVAIVLRDVFEAPVLVQFAARIDAASRIGLASTAPPPAPVARDRTIPLSFSQERLWFLDRLAPGDPAYHVISALRFRGALDAAVLERSLNEIIRRHEALRTVFPLEGETPVQRILAELTIPVPVADLARLPEKERGRALQQMIGEETRRAFSLSEGPLLRARLVRLADDEHVGLFVVHHIVFDGWSVGILNRELGAIYRAFSAGHASPLAELSPQYAEVALERRRAIEGNVLAALTAYWRRKLAGAIPPAEIPADFPRPARPSTRGGSHLFEVAPDIVTALRRAYRDENVTLFMILLAAFKLVHRHLTGDDRVAVGTDVASRGDAASHGLIGCFLNQLVLFTEIDAGDGFRALLAKVRTTVLEALAHQDLPFEKLVEAINPPRQLTATPLFQAKVVLLNLPPWRLRLPGLELTPFETESGACEFDLLLVLEEEGGRIKGNLKYRKELFGENTIAAIAAMYTGCLEELARDPDPSVIGLTSLMARIGDSVRRSARAERDRKNRQSLMGRPGAPGRT
jgi:amino acid adenylation domain-containing protein